MSHERTKSEDERLLAALAALDAEQNINNAKKHDPVQGSID